VSTISTCGELWADRSEICTNLDESLIISDKPCVYGNNNKCESKVFFYFVNIILNNIILIFNFFHMLLILFRMMLNVMILLT
jgi:hypothetical protein